MGRRQGSSRIIACLALAVLACTARADDDPLVTQQAAFARAVDLLRMGGDRGRAIEMLDAVARLGDGRAQVLLGVIYLEGKEVPQDKALGFAWLQVAARGESYFGDGSRTKAEQLIRATEPAMSGVELIRADQIESELVAERSKRDAEALQRALTVFTTEPAVRSGKALIFGQEPVQLARRVTPTDEPLFRPGCASSRGAQCPQAEELRAEPRCTGSIVKPDIAASSVPDAGTNITRPRYPAEARRWGLEGVTQVLVHSDRTGWICGVALARSSGVPGLDRAAVEAVSSWRIKPALRNAQPVESLSLFALSFRLDGYAFAE